MYQPLKRFSVQSSRQSVYESVSKKEWQGILLGQFKRKAEADCLFMNNSANEEWNEQMKNEMSPEITKPLNLVSVLGFSSQQIFSKLGKWAVQV